MAIATFERTLYSDRTPFDASAQGISQLSAAEARGQAVFNGAGRCDTCHAGTLFSDNQFHNIGLRPQAEDPGRFAVTNNANNLSEFRTPSLRNVGLRAPYFHTGQFSTLEEVVDFYNRGGDFNAPNIDRNRIRPLGLSAQQRSDLVAFLHGTLTDPRVAAGSAPFDRPVLYTESGRVPQIIGAGTVGSGGLTPQVMAIQPPIAGNPNFTVGVYGALGGTQAVLVIDGSDPGTGTVIPTNASFTRAAVQLSGSGTGQGFGSVSIQIPNNTTLIGETFYGRWYVSDPNAQGGVAVTPAFKFTVFGEAASGAPNPIDQSDFFVTQHYLDFLSRQPEQSGLDAWLNVLNKCADVNNSPGCDRITVSQSFFGSAEFQLKGSYVFRFYEAAFGRLPTFEEIVPDMRSVTGATADEVYAKKTAFTTAFAQRAEFTNAYGQLSNDAYVAALLNRYGLASVTAPEPASPDGTAKVTLTAGDLTSLLNAGTLTRAQVLRAIADSDQVSAVEYNQAFVAMQYYGYLRRTPEADGFNAWLNYLNAHPTDFRTMVHGFMASNEYRARFGQP
jgi:hypothetical protein